MNFPRRFSELPDYAFPRLRSLLDAHAPGGKTIDMSIGEPRHPMPGFVREIVQETQGQFAFYPPNNGTPELLTAISEWIKRRYNTTISSDRIMALNGSREGLYNVTIALSAEDKNGKPPTILIPDPFYQPYVAAAYAANAEPVFVPASAQNGYLSDYESLPKHILERTTVAYLCSPANPQGVIAPIDYLKRLLDLAEQYDFYLLVDECYSEIWRDTPPTGILDIAQQKAANPERVVAFNSLSKRSNMPGLRSGYVVSGPKSMKKIRQLRAYGGAPLSLPLQRIAEAAWKDEQHVEQSLALYQKKFVLTDEIFSGIDTCKTNGRVSPEGGFFLWLKTPGGNSEAATLKLWRETGVRVLPGAYLASKNTQSSVGKDYIRAALVADEETARRSLGLLRDCLYS